MIEDMQGILPEIFRAPLDDYSKTLALDPLYVRAYANRAVIYIKLQKFKEACDDMRAAYNLGLRDIYSLLPINCQ